jgi:predicted acylesterase/phospholipase RssA
MYETLIISGGGLKGLGMLALLHKEWPKIYNNTFKNYIGVSVGAILVAFLIDGYSPFEIYLIMLTYLPINYVQRQKLHEMMDQFFPYTFQELYDKTNGKRLIIPVYDLKGAKEIFYSQSSTPNSRVCDALKETTSLFPLSQNMDGCLCEPFPITYCKQQPEMNPILGVYCKNGSIVTEGCNGSIFEEIKAYFMFVVNKITQYELKAVDEKDKILCFVYSDELAQQLEINTKNAVDIFCRTFSESFLMSST